VNFAGWRCGATRVSIEWDELALRETITVNELQLMGFAALYSP